MPTIIHLIDNLGTGGAQTMMFELYNAIQKYHPSYKQLVIYQNSTNFDTVFPESYGVACQYIKDGRRIEKIVAKDSSSVVIYHKLASSNYSLIDNIKRKIKVKIIVINHTFYNSSKWKSCKNLDVMVAVSRHMEKNLKSWYPNMNISHIYNGVSGDRYKNIVPNCVDKKDIFLTGRVNRICAWKHSDKWIEWCKDVKLPKKMVHEYIGSRHGRSLTPKGSKKGRNIVKMMGGINDFNRKISIMKSWDVFLYETIRDEGISMAILESLACGVPVICSNHYGNKEIIKNGINGYVFNKKEDAREILTRLIKDPEELSNLKQSTIKHFDENLDAKHTAGKYIELIESVSKNKPIKVSDISPKEIEKDKNKFTIITSGYNKGKYLNEWADSIIKQNYRPLEVVFADDKSIDDTLAKIKGIEEKFKNNNIEFKLIENHKQLYCGGSYHNIVNYIDGFYAGVLDADDMLEDGAVEYIMNLYKNNPDIYWIYTQFLWCNEKMQNGRKGFNSAPPKGQSLLDIGDRGVHGIGCGFRTFNCKIGRIDKLFGKHLTCAVDKNMGYRLEEAGPGMFTEKMCYKHRGHPVGSKDSVSSTKNAMNMWKQVIKEAHKRRKKYKKKIYSIMNYEG